MATRVISNAIIEVDNLVFTFQADSVTIMLGLGEYEVKGLAGGSNVAAISVAEKVDTKVGSIKFSMPSGAQEIEYIPIWSANPMTHVVKVRGKDIGNGSNFYGVLNYATLANQPEIKFATDGVYECEFKGAPIVTQ